MRDFIAAACCIGQFLQAIINLAVTFVDHSGEPVLLHTVEDDDFDEEGDGGSFRLLGKSKWVEGYHKSAAITFFSSHKQLGSPLFCTQC